MGEKKEKGHFIRFPKKTKQKKESRAKSYDFSGRMDTMENNIAKNFIFTANT